MYIIGKTIFIFLIVTLVRKPLNQAEKTPTDFQIYSFLPVEMFKFSFDGTIYNFGQSTLFITALFLY